MITPPEVEDHLRSRAFAIIAAYRRNDLDAVLALVGDNDAELLPIPVEILTEALLRVVPAKPLASQLDLGTPGRPPMSAAS